MTSAQRWLSDATHALWLEGGTPQPSPLNQWSLWARRPRQVLRLDGDALSWNGTVWRLKSPEMLWSVLQEALRACRRFETAGLPFSGGLMGYFGYDAARWMEPALERSGWPAHPSPMPSLLLCEFSEVFLGRVGDAVPVALGDADPADWSPDWVDPTAASGATFSTDTPWVPSFNESDFCTAVDRLLGHIRAGESYQANLSIRWESQLTADPWALYTAIRRRNPSPFGGLWLAPDHAVLCNSPERLVQVTPEGIVETRPIAGTRGRGDARRGDDWIGQQLRENPKEQAEHRMLVDLARNDLGRVCTPASVQVTDLMTLERYSAVTHLVSRVEGQCGPDVSSWEVLRALFPGGTITGCPKLRSIQLLDALEPVSRGLYTGGLGYLDAHTGAMDWNILIRSLLLRRADVTDNTHGPWTAWVHAGAGIVADSVGPHEYLECLRKAAAWFDLLPPPSIVSPMSEVSTLR